MKVISGNKDNFDSIVINSKTPVLVDFNATWCGPCRMLGPILEELAEETDKVQIVSIDVDENELLARDYDIYSIPCLILFKDGVEVKRSVGFMSKEDLVNFIGE